MMKEEKRWITPAPVELPEFVGEVQEETTAGAVEGELTLDGDGRKNPPDTGAATETATEAASNTATNTATETATETATKTTTETATKTTTVPDIDPIWQPWGAAQPQKPPSLIDKSKPVAPKPLTIIDTTGKSVEDLMVAYNMTAAQLSSAGKKVLSPQQKRDLDKYYVPPEFSKKLSEANKWVSEAMEHPVVQFGKRVVEEAAYIGVLNKLFGSSGSVAKPAPQTKGADKVIDLSDYRKAVGK